MSATAAARTPAARRPRPAPLPGTGPTGAGAGTTTPSPRPRLRLVRAPQQTRTRVPFVLLCMAVLGAALLAALLLNTAMAGGAYDTYDLSSELGRLQQDGKDLQAQLDERSSPAQLADAARGLGMVPAEGTGWVRLGDGTTPGTVTGGTQG